MTCMSFKMRRQCEKSKILLSEKQTVNQGKQTPFPVLIQVKLELQQVSANYGMMAHVVSTVMRSEK